MANKLKSKLLIAVLFACAVHSSICAPQSDGQYSPHLPSFVTGQDDREQGNNREPADPTDLHIEADPEFDLDDEAEREQDGDEDFEAADNDREVNALLSQIHDSALDADAGGQRQQEVQANQYLTPLGDAPPRSEAVRNKRSFQLPEGYVVDQETLEAYIRAMSDNRNRREGNEESQEVIYVDGGGQPRWQRSNQMGGRRWRRQLSVPLSLGSRYNAGGLGKGIVLSGQLVRLDGFQSLADNLKPPREPFQDEGSDEGHAVWRASESPQAESSQDVEEAGQTQEHGDLEEEAAYVVNQIRQPARSPKQHSSAYAQPQNFRQLSRRPGRTQALVFVVPYPVPVPVPVPHYRHRSRHRPFSGFPTPSQHSNFDMARLPRQPQLQFQQQHIYETAGYYQGIPFQHPIPQVAFGFQKPVSQSKLIYNQGLAAIEYAAEPHPEESQEIGEGYGHRGNNFAPVVTTGRQQGYRSQQLPRGIPKTAQQTLFRGQVSSPAFIHKAIGTLESRAAEILGVVTPEVAGTTGEGEYQNDVHPFFVSNVQEGAQGWHGSSSKIRAVEEYPYMV